MRIPSRLSRLLSIRQRPIGIGLVLVALLGACGTLLLTDEPGLRAEYFALGEPWQGSPMVTSVGEPSLGDALEVRKALLTTVVFSIRWSGWWAVAQEGEHRFFLDADDGGYLRIDDELVVESSDGATEGGAAGRKVLAPGFHAVEIGLYQTHGDSRLTIHWVAPGSVDDQAVSLPSGDLYSGRPLILRKMSRWALGHWPAACRRLLGVFLLLVAVSLLPGVARRFEGSLSRLHARIRAVDGATLRTALLFALFVLVFLASFPLTGMVRGGDDTSYLDTATFTRKQWYFNRYAHVYLLKAFVTLSGGDPLIGVRVWWSFVLATTVAALAVAVRSIGPGLQLRTLAATLLVLLAQPIVFGLIGSGFADYSTMMFVTLAVATYLHGVATAREHSPPRREWHALAIGVFTVGAFRSKEVGAVLLVLPVLFLIGRGASLDWRGFARKVVYWTAGAVAALALLTLLDGWILGDFFFTWDRSRLSSSGGLNFPQRVGLRKTNWLNNVWHGEAMRSLWLGVSAAALAAGFCRRRLEHRLLHLLPIAYLVALIALYVRLPHPFSDRMLIPIVPVACLMTGLLLHYAGLDELPWKQLLHPAALVTGGLAVAFVAMVVVPYRLGSLEIANLLPVEILRRYGWAPDHFAVGMLLPAAVLIALAGVALVAGRRRGRVTALLVAYAVFFGFGFEITRVSLAQNRARQRGELLVYPWKAFRDQLRDASAGLIALSSDLRFQYQMSGATRTSLARVGLNRRDVRVSNAYELPTGVEVAIASRYTYDAWLRQMPALAETASFHPHGFLVLVHPSQAAELQRQQTGSLREPPASIVEVLDGLKRDRDPEVWSERLQWILDGIYAGEVGWLGLQYLQGNQLRGVALTHDGWTDGTNPAGLIVVNRGARPLTQRLAIGVGGGREDPFRVFVDDGERVETVVFDRPGPRKIKIGPVPARTTRLFLVWSDQAWSPGGADTRKLGVRLRVPRQQQRR